MKKMFRLVAMTTFLLVTNFSYNLDFVGFSENTNNILGVEQVVAQDLPNANVDLDNLERESEGLLKMIWKIAKYVVGVVLLIGLITVIWMVSQNNPKSKEAVIGWVVAVGIYAIALSIL